MARKRMIDPAFWTDEALGACDPTTRLLFMGLISQADDAGRLRGAPALIRSQVFPYDDMTVADVDTMLDKLHRRRLIVRYGADGQSYIWVRSFEKHQTINRPTESRLPPPPDDTTHGGLTEDSVSHHGALTPNRREEKLREEKGIEPLAPAKPSREVRSRSIPASRPRNETWDALAALCGEPETASERGDFGKTVKELDEARASPDEIAAFGPWWWQHHPDAQLTHRCLRQHFGRFRNQPERPFQPSDIKNPMVRAALTADLSGIEAELREKATNGHSPRGISGPFGGPRELPADARRLGAGEHAES